MDESSCNAPQMLPVNQCHIHTYIHPFNGPFSGTTRVSQYQIGKTNLDFTEARDSEWQWHQLGHIQVCTSLQTDNDTSTPALSFLQPDALPATQPTASKHSQQKNWRKVPPRYELGFLDSESRVPTVTCHITIINRHIQTCKHLQHTQ